MKKNIIASFLKFAVYINNHKMLLIYFWPHFEKQDGRHKCFLSVMKSAYISLIIDPRGLG